MNGRFFGAVQMMNNRAEYGGGLSVGDNSYTRYDCRAQGAL